MLTLNLVCAHTFVEYISQKTGSLSRSNDPVRQKENVSESWLTSKCGTGTVIHHREDNDEEELLVRTFGCWVTLGKIGTRDYIIQEIVHVVCVVVDHIVLDQRRVQIKRTAPPVKTQFLARFIVGLCF